MIRNAALVAYAAACSIASADIVELDDGVFGAGSVTLDTDTGLQWLDLTLSTDLSANEVDAQLGVGGTFEGWRYASVAEVLTLFVNAGIPDVPGQSSANIAPAQALMDFVGSTGFQAGIGDGRQAFGITGDKSGGLRRRADMDGLMVNGMPEMSVGAFAFQNPNGGAPVLGSWLVRVPHPGTLAVLACGSVGACRRSRSRERAYPGGSR